MNKMIVDEGKREGGSKDCVGWVQSSHNRQSGRWTEPEIDRQVCYVETDGHY